MSGYLLMIFFHQSSIELGRGMLKYFISALWTSYKLIIKKYHITYQLITLLFFLKTTGSFLRSLCLFVLPLVLYRLQKYVKVPECYLFFFILLLLPTNV
jgi:hypothetical protein